MLLKGDCLKWMRMLPPESFHACVTDGPYHIPSIQARFGSPDSVPARDQRDGAMVRAANRFIGAESVNSGDICFRPETWAEAYRLLKPGGHLAAFGFSRNFHHMAVAIEAAGFEIRDNLSWLYGTGLVRCEDLGKQTGRPDLKGWRRELKPAHEPIVLARKPLSEGSVAANMIKHRTGALNIADCSPGGKYAANIIHDGIIDKPFFYCAKASTAERAGSEHPTVKPLALMRWLVRLVTPPGGKVLDPFAGTGTTLEAALLEGMRPTGIEKEAEYWPDIERRLQRHE